MIDTVSAEVHALGRDLDDEVVVVNDVVDVIIDAAADFIDICTHGRLVAVEVNIVCRQLNILADAAAGGNDIIYRAAEHVSARRATAVAGAPELDLSAYLSVLGKILLQERKRGVAADGKARVLAFKADIQVACPFGIVAAATQADTDNGVFLAVYVYDLVCNAYAEGVSAGSFGIVLVGLEILEAYLIKEIDKVCRAFLVPCGIGNITRRKAHCHGHGREILPVVIACLSKILIAIGKRAGVIRFRIVMSGIEHDRAGDSLILVPRCKHRQRRKGNHQH